MLLEAVRRGLPLLLLALVGCGRSAPGEADRSAAAVSAAPTGATPRNAPTPAERAARAHLSDQGDAAPYYTDLQLAEFMPHVMQYAADGIWKRQGYVYDRAGLRSLFPKSDEEWEEAESGARTLAEITNVLLIPGRRVPDPRWDEAALGVRRVALQAADAAERKNPDAWFKAGGDLDEACDACHEKFDPSMAKGRS